MSSNIHTDESSGKDSDVQVVSHAELRELLESISRVFNRNYLEISSLMKKWLEEVIGEMEHLSIQVAASPTASNNKTHSDQSLRQSEGVFYKWNAVKSIRINLGTFAGNSDPLDSLSCTRKFFRFHNILADIDKLDTMSF